MSEGCLEIPSGGPINLVARGSELGERGRGVAKVDIEPGMRRHWPGSKEASAGRCLNEWQICVLNNYPG